MVDRIKPTTLFVAIAVNGFPAFSAYTRPEVDGWLAVIGLKDPRRPFKVRAFVPRDWALERLQDILQKVDQAFAEERLCCDASIAGDADIRNERLDPTEEDSDGD